MSLFSLSNALSLEELTQLEQLHAKYHGYLMDTYDSKMPLDKQLDAFSSVAYGPLLGDVRRYSNLWKNTAVVQYCCFFAKKNINQTFSHDAQMLSFRIWQLLRDTAISAYMDVHMSWILSSGERFELLPLEPEHAIFSQHSSMYFAFFEKSYMTNDDYVQLDQERVVRYARQLLACKQYPPAVAEALTWWLNIRKKNGQLTSILDTMINLHGGNIDSENVSSILDEYYNMRVLDGSIPVECLLHIS